MLHKSGRSQISALLVIALLLSTFMPVMAFGASLQFNDTVDSYAQQEITALVEAGIISGYEDHTFQPKKAMTRAELAKIIVLSMGLKENPEKAAAFRDIDAESWYRGYVGALVESGITQGTSASSFSPDSKVTREELVVFFVRAFGLEETAKKAPLDGKLSDMADISDWAKAHVSLAFQIGFVNGIENNDGTLKFGPKEHAERQALARLAYEFKTNKSKFEDKAKMLIAALPGDKQPEQPPVPNATTPDAAGSSGTTSGNGRRDDDNQYFTVTSVRALDNQTVQVTLNNTIRRVGDVRSFSIDGELSVSNTEIKAGTTDVVLTTSLQNAGQLYKLSYGGADTGKTFEGAATTLTSVEAQEYAEDYQIVQEGTYGPGSGLATFKGDLFIAGPGITLQNVLIEGNLIIGSAVGEGDLTLNTVEVKGDTIVRGGGANSIHLNNTIMFSIIVDKHSGAVRLVADNGTSVAQVTLQSSVTLESDSTAPVFRNVNIAQSMPANSTVQLAGVFETVDVIATNIAVSVPRGSIENFNLDPLALGNLLDLGNDATIVVGDFGARLHIAGIGRILQAITRVEGITTEIEFGHTTGFPATKTEATGTPKLYFANLTNGSIQLKFNQVVADAAAEDFIVTATVNDQPAALEQLVYHSAEQNFTFLPLDAAQYQGQELKVTVAPVEARGKFTRSSTAKINITGFEGTIVDVNDNAVAGITIQFRRGIGSVVGTVVATVVTDAQGRYHVTLPPGTYTGELTGPGFITTYLVGVAADNVYNQHENATAIRIPGESETRIVLVWGQDPRDLDSHLVGPTPDASSQFHTWYGGKQYSYNNSLFDDLDHDDVTAYGPETTTIRQDVYGTYRFYVHHYSGASTLRKSGAEVKVFRGSNPEPLRAYTIPSGDGTERYWAAFDMTISESGTSFQEINQLFSTEQEAAGGSRNIAVLDSNVYTVNNSTNVISNVAEGTSAADFKSKLTAPSSVTFNVYEADGLTVKSGSIANNDKVIALAANGITKKSYSIMTNAVDHEAPAAVTGVTYGQLTATSLRLTWNLPSGTNDTVGYAVYQDNNRIGDVTNTNTVNGATYNVTGLTQGTAYSFIVKAYDAAFNYSLPSNVVQVTTPVSLSVYGLSSSSNSSVTAGVYGPFARENSTGPYRVTNEVQNTDYLVVKFSDSMSQDSLAGTITIGNDVTVDGLSGTVEASVYGEEHLVFRTNGGLSDGAHTITIHGLRYGVSSQVYQLEPVVLEIIKE